MQCSKTAVIRSPRRRGQAVRADHAPLACAMAVILWGPDASSDKLRTAARCTACGGKGATLQHPGWAGKHVCFYPFPTGIADQMKPCSGHLGLPDLVQNALGSFPPPGPLKNRPLVSL
jgi:hypothetical protein